MLFQTVDKLKRQSLVEYPCKSVFGDRYNTTIHCVCWRYASYLAMAYIPILAFNALSNLAIKRIMPKR